MSDYMCANRCVFHPGDTVGSKYRVRKMLGAGTFGCVYLVTDGHGEYALKLLKLWEVPAQERPELLKRFDMEYQTGLIASNYLVHSIEKGSAEGNPYIVMEFCEGGDLMTAAERGQVDFTRAARHVLYGLRDLHRHGKVHRDLKPENVLLRADGTAILTDFGISGDQNNRMTQRGILGVPQQRFGTFAYMPPEQVNPKRGNATVLPTTDIFSFGVMMYQLLTYQLPFGDLQTEADLPRYTGNGKRGIWNRQLLSQAQNGAAWLRLIEGCLEPDFRQRLQDADAVLALLPQGGGSGIYQPVYGASQITSNAPACGSVRLKIMQGEEYGRTYLLTDYLQGMRRIVTVGRASDDVSNDIAITENMSNYVSRSHCTLEMNNQTGLWIIRDGQWRNKAWQLSLNGTYVNSVEAGKDGIALKIGDIISIGDVKIRVEN